MAGSYLLSAQTPLRRSPRYLSSPARLDWGRIRATRLILASIFLCSLLPTATRAAESYSVWFAPDGASPDLLDLFRRPELWSRARSQIDVFKFGPVRLTRQANVKRNSFEELNDVDAFRKLRSWGLKTASEEGAIKPWDCTGTQAAKVTNVHIRNVHAAGGAIDIIAMDEPLSSGRQPCGLSILEAAKRTATFVRDVESSDETKSAGVVPVVGDIEPYPSSSVNDIQEWTQDLLASGFRPAFIHIDINVHFVDVHPATDIKGDLRSLRSFFQEKGIPFGIIIWSGYDPLNSDKAYYEHAMRVVKTVNEAIGRPNQVIFQSWVTRSAESCQQSDGSCNAKSCAAADPPYCGENSIPLNLPEKGPASFSHTRLINDGLAAFAAK
jgi:hypothetical protein